MTSEETVKFLCDIRNEDNCDECPYNVGADSSQYRKPCGEWYCWVTVHCEDRRDI